ncbi:MAG: hypothetical protein P8178_03230 [Candidatus Thiodiazotropha sp.]
MPIAATKSAPFGLRSYAIRYAALGLALMAVPAMSAMGATKAGWFPDPPSTPHFIWSYKPCDGCRDLQPGSAWLKMSDRAGLRDIHFLLAPDETNGPAYSYPPDAVVLSPAALKLKPCQLSFLVGHELVHIAQRHFDEDAMVLSVLSGKAPAWTRDGNRAMHLLDDDFLLALRMSPTWQQQEREADWIGALLAADACGCTVEQGAFSYLQGDADAGGGVAAAHESSRERLHFLQAFDESAKRLAARAD